ncbi:MAG: carboxypeptidase-like regulatory domain-containing protein, partial [Armatimonadetes bacterium]|nr:carboxypeptidase-like regulatory domain-containing protein [Armatimonadota bacterium]
MITINTRKFFIIVGFVLIAAAMACQIACAGVNISVEKKGTYTYWLTFKDAKGVQEATTPSRFKGKETDFDAKLLGPKFADAKLHIMLMRSGNEAIVDYKASADPKKPAEIAIKEADFQYVPSVSITVVSEDGDPLASAKIVLTDGEGAKMLKVLTPADNGVAVFSDVAVGDVEVKVAADGLKKTIDGEFELPEKRESAGFSKEVKVSGDVGTLPVVAKTGEKQSKAEPKPSGNAGFLQTIVGLLFLAVVVAIIAVVVKSRGFTAKAALQQLGVNIPADQPIGAGSAVPGTVINPNVCEFCGQTKDASGNCSCSVIGGAAPFGAASAGPSGPRLIGAQGTYSGTIFMISGGSAVI